MFPNTRLITAVPQKNIGFSKWEQLHTYLLPSHSPTPFRCWCSFEERQVTNKCSETPSLTLQIHLSLSTEVPWCQLRANRVSWGQVKRRHRRHFACRHFAWRLQNDVTLFARLEFERCLRCLTCCWRSTALVLTKHAPQVRLSNSWIFLIKVSGEVNG